jgi:hypothetical protein
MANDSQKQQDHSENGNGQQHKIAVPYVPPPPPDESVQKRFKSPVVNAAIISGIILLVGFMAYNFAGHELTRLAGESNVQEVQTLSPTPSISPTPTPAPTGAY